MEFLSSKSMGVFKVLTLLATWSTITACTANMRTTKVATIPAIMFTDVPAPTAAKKAEQEITWSTDGALMLWALGPEGWGTDALAEAMKTPNLPTDAYFEGRLNQLFYWLIVATGEHASIEGRWVHLVKQPLPPEPGPSGADANE